VLYLNAVLESREADFAQRASILTAPSLLIRTIRIPAALGSILAKLDDLPGARQHLEKAIALGDADPEVQYDLGKVCSGWAIPHKRRRSCARISS